MALVRQLAPAVEAAANGFETVSDNHEIVVDLPDDIPMVIADTRAVEQVLGQLIENAIKYSPDGGPVRITADVHPDVVAVQVRDKGIGLGPGDAERVFNRYYRARTSATADIKGVGLGLYIARQLVEAMGGTIRCSGARGEGSTFEFTLPIAAPDAVASGARPRQ